MIINILINMAIIAILLFADAWFDSFKIKKGKTIHHTGEAITLSLLAILAFLFNYKVDLLLYAAWIFHFACMRLLLFNRILNRFMGWEDDYLGETSTQDNAFKWLKKRGLDRIIRVSAVMLSSFLLVGRLTSVFLNERQESLLAWVIFSSIALVGCVFVYQVFGGFSNDNDYDHGEDF